MRISLHPQTPQARLMLRILESLEKGGLAVYPTDSGYSLGCDALNKGAVEKLYHLKRAMKKYLMGLMVRDFSRIPEFARLENEAYRYMKRLVPGPYTFILPATTRGKKILDVNRPEIGIRMPTCPFGDALFALKPDMVLLTTAARIRDEDGFTDPDEIEAAFGHAVEIVADLGPVPQNPTTVIRLVTGEPEVLRHGAGALP